VPVQTNLVQTNRKDNSKSQSDDKILQSTVNAAESAMFHLKVHHQKPHVEHRERGTTHFSHANVKNFQEPLSKHELHILSELALAASMPDEVRVSLQRFIDEQQSVDGVQTVEHSVDRPKKPSTPMVEWNYDEIHEPHKLKELLGHVAKVLQADKKKMVELAAEREWMLKEEAYHASMASFVELCIRTGMVR
jgi:HPt (histidine-containing phosphotransfer) domain-containing protein